MINKQMKPQCPSDTSMLNLVSVIQLNNMANIPLTPKQEELHFGQNNKMDQELEFQSKSSQTPNYFHYINGNEKKQIMIQNQSSGDSEIIKIRCQTIQSQQCNKKDLNYQSYEEEDSLEEKSNDDSEFLIKPKKIRKNMDKKHNKDQNTRVFQYKSPYQDTKNIPKNYCKAMVQYADNNKTFFKQKLQKIGNYEKFTEFLDCRKDKILSIKEFKRLLFGEEKFSQQEMKSCKIMRILFFRFLRKDFITYLYSNKKFKSKDLMLKYSEYMKTMVKNPDDFTSWKKYEKK